MKMVVVRTTTTLPMTMGLRITATVVDDNRDIYNNKILPIAMKTKLTMTKTRMLTLTMIVTISNEKYLSIA